MREAIFNILAGLEKEAVVLDLFAGTGALGLEALSRGARSALFVDNDPDALLLLKKNIKACDMLAETRAIMWNIARDLNCLKGMPATFNLVFMDPPYDRKLVRPTLDLLHRSQALQPAARIVAEHGPDEPLSTHSDCFLMADQRRYGKSLVSFFRYMV